MPDRPNLLAYVVTVSLKMPGDPFFGIGFPAQFSLNGTAAPPLVLMRGQTYTFQMSNVPTIHEFYITTSNVGEGADPYDNGVTGQDANGNSVLTFTVPTDAPDLLYYQCGVHPNMGNMITIVSTIPSPTTMPTPTYSPPIVFPSGVHVEN